MRLKLLVAVSILAALIGAGSCIAIVSFAFSSLKPFTSPGLLVVATFLLPLGAILLASVFVYRHTARRRKLQAFLTALIATVLTLSLLVLASFLSSRRGKIEPPQPEGPRITS